MTRANYLTVLQVELLEGWGVQLRRAFHGVIPYHVGSSITRPDYRDVDVRVILDDDEVVALDAILNRRMFGVALSAWGERATGLPIDCQVQSMTEANVPEHGARQALSIRTRFGRPS